MSGERKNTITKSATANTTTKKGLSQGQADILIAIVAMTWGSSYLMMKIGLTGMPPFSIIALRFCIALDVHGDCRGLCCWCRAVQKQKTQQPVLYPVLSRWHWFIYRVLC